MTPSDYKVGGKVRRIKCGNGEGAGVGQVATVEVVEDDFVYVRYPGCRDEGYDGCEGWFMGFAEPVEGL